MSHPKPYNMIFKLSNIIKLNVCIVNGGKEIDSVKLLWVFYLTGTCWQ